MRSGTTACCTGFNDPRSTPTIVNVDEPIPEICAPISTSKSHKSATSGSRAAFSIIVSPLACTAAVRMFSVAPTDGKSRVMCAPCKLSARASMLPFDKSNSAPIAVSPAMCISIGRVPKSSPPGISSRTWPLHANNGPSKLIDARIVSTNSDGAIDFTSPRLVNNKTSAR